MDAIFQARVAKGGRVVWLNPGRTMDFFKSIAGEHGQRVTVIVEEPNRSNDQNRYLHAIFREASQRTGYSPAQMKAYLKALYVEDGRGTSELGSGEASDFAEFCQSWIAEHLD